MAITKTTKVSRIEIALATDAQTVFGALVNRLTGYWDDENMRWDAPPAEVQSPLSVAVNDGLGEDLSGILGNALSAALAEIDRLNAVIAGAETSD